MAYGSPERDDDLLAYYTDIRRGRPPTDDQLAELRRRYDAIGGLSPLGELTRAQARALAGALGPDWRVELGLKHVHPTIEEAAGTLASAGVEDAVGLVLAPHTSVLSTGQYHERALTAFDATGVTYRPVGRWGHHPGLVGLLADRVRAGLGRFPPGERVELVVTAHSLPERVLDMDEPSYPAQLRETAELVAAAAQVEAVTTAWQSAGRTPEAWLGPDVRDVVRAATSPVLVCPAGFTADHLEVLYDLDVEAAAVAREAGVRLERTESLNDDPRFVAVLRDLVRAA